MKSLVESLFDNDLTKKDLCIGDVYKLSSTPHDNYFSNDPFLFVDLFKEKELKKIKGNYTYVDPNNGFVEYWDGMKDNLKGFGISPVIDIILRAPISIITKPYSTDCESEFKKYLEPYIHSLDYKDFRVFINFYNKKRDIIKLSFYDNILDSRPSSMTIHLEKI